MRSFSRGVIWRRPQWFSAIRYVALLPRWVHELYCLTTYTGYCGVKSILFHLTPWHRSLLTAFTRASYQSLYWATCTKSMSLWTVHFLLCTLVCAQVSPKLTSSVTVLILKLCILFSPLPCQALVTGLSLCGGLGLIPGWSTWDLIWQSGNGTCFSLSSSVFPS